MSKWEKLNNELSEVLDTMSSEAWQAWQANRAQNKALRLEQQKLAAELHLKQLEIKEQSQMFLEEFIYWKDLKLDGNAHNDQLVNVAENGGTNYAMAA